MKKPLTTTEHARLRQLAITQPFHKAPPVGQVLRPPDRQAVVAAAEYDALKDRAITDEMAAAGVDYATAHNTINHRLQRAAFDARNPANLARAESPARRAATPPAAVPRGVQTAWDKLRQQQGAERGNP